MQSSDIGEIHLSLIFIYSLLMLLLRIKVILQPKGTHLPKMVILLPRQVILLPRQVILLPRQVTLLPKQVIHHPRQTILKRLLDIHLSSRLLRLQ